MKFLNSDFIQSGFRQMNVMLVLPILAAALFSFKSCTSLAQGKFSKPVCEHSVGIVDGKTDYGVKVSVEVKNVGRGGYLNIMSELSTSEGEWNRTQDLYFKSGESRTLTYFFHEPTINSTNFQCRVGIFPL